MTKSSRKIAVVEMPKIEKTPEQKLTDAWENLTHTLDHELRSSQEKLDKWSVRFGEDPTNAFEWSADAFTEAARNRVVKEVKHYVDRAMERGDDYVTPSKLEVMREVRRVLYEDVLRKAKWPEHSTSTPHNLIHQELTAKRAEWLEQFDNLLKRNGA